jgi:hypothetical protein
MNDQAAKANAAPTVSAPVFNISVGDGVLDLFCPRVSIQDAPPPALWPPLPVTTSHEVPIVLLPAHDIGPDISIKEFCTLYGLQPSVQKKLEDNEYLHA